MPRDPNVKAPMTTIKVPVPLRQRIAGDAAEEGVTAAVFLARLVDLYERERRLGAVRRAYQDGPDRNYAELTQEWDALSGADVDSD